MKKATNVLTVILTAFILSACGSGGGTSSDPSNGGGTGGGGGGGGSSGGDGNAAYYGFSTDSSSKISNQATPLTSGVNQLTIASQVTFNLRNLNNRTLDVMIYQPTCIVGLLTETYSAIFNQRSYNFAVHCFNRGECHGRHLSRASHALRGASL